MTGEPSPSNQLSSGCQTRRVGLLLLRSAIAELRHLAQLGRVRRGGRELCLGYLGPGYRGKIFSEVVFAVANSALTYVGIELVGKARWT